MCILPVQIKLVGLESRCFEGSVFVISVLSMHFPCEPWLERKWWRQHLAERKCCCWRVSLCWKGEATLDGSHLKKINWPSHSFPKCFKGSPCSLETEQAIPSGGGSACWVRPGSDGISQLRTRGRWGNGSPSLACGVGNLPCEFWGLWKARKEPQVGNFCLGGRSKRGRLCTCWILGFLCDRHI